MHTAAERLEFAPPATPGVTRAFMLALLAHGLLVAALTWGVHWQRDAQIVSAEAELWASVPAAAAPRLQTPTQEPAQEPTPKPKPIPKSLPEPPPPEKPPAVVAKPVALPPPVIERPKVDIALEQEKKRLQKQKQLELAQQQDKLKQDKLKQAKLQQEKQKLEQLKADKLKQAQAEQLKQAQDEKLKQAQAEKTKLAQDKKLAEQQAKQLEALRADQLKRIAGLAGASGAADATGAALKSAGPSAGYAGRIVARIKPNIVFTEAISGNPTAVVEVHAGPDGKILASKLTQSSGVKAWDEAVLRAIAKTEVLPRDTDGRVPSPLEIRFRPKD